MSAYIFVFDALSAILFFLSMICPSYGEQGSAHGIQFRQTSIQSGQKYIVYRNRCLRLGKVEYDQIGGMVNANWHPFRLP